MFVGSNGKSGKKVHFRAFWSSFGLGMDSLFMEQGGWMNLKFKRGKEHATNLEKQIQDKEDKERARNMEHYIRHYPKPYRILSKLPYLILTLS